MKVLILAAPLVATALVCQPALAQPPKPVDQNPQAQMDKIRQTQDPQERERLLQEHWDSMQSAMTAMHGMWGPASARCCPGWLGHGSGDDEGFRDGLGHMRGYYSGLSQEQMRQRQYMLDQYMPMQQMMMDQMMWHQRWTAPQAPATPK